MTFEEILENLTKAQQRCAVYQALVDYLEEHLPTDLDVASNGAPLPTDMNIITVTETRCLEPVVPVAVVEGVLGEVSSLLQKSEEEIRKIRGLPPADDPRNPEGGGS
jgi:hypothetical protein